MPTATTTAGAAATTTAAATSAAAVHPMSEVGFGGAGLAAYEAARATYPTSAVAHAVAALGLAPGAKVLDVAAGTGKLTRALLAQPGGLQVAACEPNAGMLEGFSRACPGVPVKQADAAHLPYADGEFDAVFVGQAYHWFANEEATRELRRVIKPGGGLALLWNMEDGAAPWMREFLDVLEPWALKAGVPNYALLINLCSGLGTHLAAIQSDWFAALFDMTPSLESHSTLFRWARPLTRAGAWLRVMSNSYIASLPAEVREAEVRPAVDAWIAKHAGRFAAPPGGGDGGKAAEQEDEVAMFELVTEAFVCKRVG